MNSSKEMESNKNIRFSPYPFTLVGEKNVFANVSVDKLEWNKSEELLIYIHMSLVNRKMLENDKILFNKEYRNKSKAYMFFYEFTSVKSFSFEQLVEILPILLNDDSLSTTFLKKILLDPKGLKMHILESIYNLMCTNEHLVWLGAQIYDYENDYNEIKSNQISELGANIFAGDLLFSASPVLSKECLIKIKLLDDNVLSKEFKIYDKYDLKEFSVNFQEKCKIKNTLDKFIMPNIKSAKSTIFNVGQANCIYNCVDSTKFFFDIGVTKFKNDREKENITKAFSKIRKCGADFVVISHWDMDHILGITDAHSSLNCCLWLAPKPNNKCNRNIVSIKRLCGFLKFNNADIILVDNSFDEQEVYESAGENFKLWKGKECSKKGISASNNTVLILKLKNKESILMMGDCENSIPNEDMFNNNYKYIVVSHHGSKMSESQIKEYVGRRGIAVVSVGTERGNMKENPNLSDEYLKKNYVLKKTKNFVKKFEYEIIL